MFVKLSLSPLSFSSSIFEMGQVHYSKKKKKKKKKMYETKNQERMANSVNPDEVTHYEQSNLDLLSLQRHLF